MGVRFVPLHVYSRYSLLEGVDAAAALLERAAEAGYGVLALTDVNSLAGAVEFTEAAPKFGVRPILGARLRGQTQKATALIGEPAGWASLCKILSRLHGQGGVPLLNVLCESPEGLHLLVDDPFLLKAPLTDCYRGRLWVELFRLGRAAAKENALVEAGAKCGARPVASLGAHFATPAGHAAYRLVTAIRQGKPLDELPVRLPVGPACHLLDPQAALERFRDLPDAITNTERLAEACRSDVLPRGAVPPPAKLPEGQDAESYLRLLCDRAMPQRPWDDEPAARRRLEQELALVRQHGLASYFLAVHEISAEARRRGWPMALRGSAGSSLLCFLLGITDINPLKYSIRLDRFINPGRSDVPDIDLDFAAQFRRPLFEWVVQHFGAQHVARVGLFEHWQVRSAFEAAATAHGATKAQLRPLMDALREGDLKALVRGESPEGMELAPAAWPLEPERWPRVLADARLLVGRPHKLGPHPSGFVLTDRDAQEYAPLQRWGGHNLAQLDKEGVERVGLVKLDLLSNRALSTLAEARQQVQALAAPGAAARPVEDADPATLALLVRGDTLGVSQLERPSVRQLLRQLRPRGLSDLIQALAVLRPGAAADGWRETYLRRRCGREQAQYPHPLLEEVLRESCGVMLFQDDALAVIEALTGLAPAEADRLRKELADPDKAEETSAAFVSLCEKFGVERLAADLVLGQLARFSSYTFCRSHAVSYATVAWQECHVKAHYPLAFWVGALNNHHGVYPLRVYVEAAKRAGLSVWLPCINRSLVTFTQEVTGIRSGLGAIRGLDRASAEAVVEQRQQGSPFQGLTDFRQRAGIPPQDVELLIRAGALDFTGQSRQALLREVEAGQRNRPPAWWVGRERRGVESWPLEGLPAEYTLKDQWKEEWGLLGFLCGPPLMSLVRACVPPELPDSRSLRAHAGGRVRLAGLVAPARGDPPADEQTDFTIEDEWGLVEVRGAEAVGDKLAALGPVVVVEGKVEDRFGVPVVTEARLERLLPGASFGPVAMPSAEPGRNGAGTYRNGTARPA